MSDDLTQGRARAMAMTGWILSGLFALFMVGASAAPKLLGLEAATSSFDALGWPQRYVLMIGLLEIGFTLLFLYSGTVLTWEQFGQVDSVWHWCGSLVFAPGPNPFA